ncbi:MAG: Uncharacterised protein [Hyphomonas sp. TMED17]|nr:MAG: Uncharacterised protein [Hyphomonas sp. TMED17]
MAGFGPGFMTGFVACFVSCFIAGLTVSWHQQLGDGYLVAEPVHPD